MTKQGKPWGGTWTQQKLTMLEEYLKAYASALKAQPFERWYIDAFAGTGYRELETEESGTASLFPELLEDEPQSFMDGSARVALRVEPAFHRFVFVERSPRRFQELQNLRNEFPALARRLKFVRKDCNVILRHLCSNENWARVRAVLFLDPFGMQVEWQTLEALASTRAVDMWILFPLSAVNRVLTRSGEIPEGWSERLTKLFGTGEWRQAFYGRQQTLWKDAATVKTATFAAIGDFFLQRLRSVFADVADNPRVLYDSHDHPLFLLCFAVANERGAPIARRIAQHILKG